MNTLDPVFRVLLSPPFLKLWSLFALATALGLILRSALFKGWLGEQIVRLIFWFRLPKSAYTVLHNVTFPTEDGTTQIDHIIVSPHGIFVVEKKNMTGWIFGTERQAMWTQQIFKCKNQFQNPLRQNYKHTETLRELLQLPSDVIHSVIVFIGGVTFKTEMPANVTTSGHCADHILAHTDHVIGDESVQEIIECIRENRLTAGLRTHIQHVNEIKARQTVN